MADEVVVQAPKATVYVERKIQVRNFEPLTVGIHFPVELPMPLDFGTEDEGFEAYTRAVNEAIKGAFFTAKAHVYEQAAVKFEDKDGVLVEMVTAKFEGAAEVVPTSAPQSSAADRPTDTGGGDRPGFGDRQCPKCKGPMWDNRARKTNPKAPDFKCKDKDNCDGVIWPPKNAR